MRTPGRRRGITLIEVIVLVIIVAILLALLLPAIHNGNGGRRNTCANNMRNVGLSLIGYEESNGAYPGYANVVYRKRASWAVPILPYLERDDLYQIWANTSPVALPLPTGSSGSALKNVEATPNPWAHADISVFICPINANSAIANNPLSYVVNCGSARTANDFLPPITPANSWVEDWNGGVFFNRARADFALSRPDPNPPDGSFAPNKGPVVTTAFISQHDGTSNTILMSENLQASTWATDPTDTINRPPNPFQSEFQIKQNTGIVWFVIGSKNNSNPASPTASYNPAGIQINALAGQVRTPVAALAYPIPNSKPPSGGLAYARPSSLHSGGVNVMFCDGHLRFVADDIDYKVYTQLMTPNGRDVIVAMPDKTAVDAGWDYQLNEYDY